jgi:hypothetical protein
MLTVATTSSIHRLTLKSVSDPGAQLKVDIRNAPIHEEDGDASAALANVANTLRVRNDYSVC